MLSKRGARYLAATRTRRAKAAAAARAGPAVPITAMARFNRSGSELKSFTSGLPAGFNSIGNAWVETDVFSAIAQGDDISQRNGRRIYVRAIEIRGVLAGAQSNIVTDDAYNDLRLIVAKYTGGTGNITPLASAGAGMSLTSAIIPGNGHNCQRVFYDQLHTLQSPGRDSVGYVATAKTITIKLKTPMLVTFSGTAAGTQMDHVVISATSDSLVAPNPGFTFMSYTVYFTD